MESRKRVVVGLTAAAIALIVLGIAAVVVDSGFSGGLSPIGSASLPATGPDSSSIGGPSPSVTAQTPSGSPGETPSEISPSPSFVPTPSARAAGFVVSGGSIVYYTADGTPVPMEPVRGLRMALVGGRARYYALSPNPYGLRTGAYAGEFMPDVTTEQADGSSALTGGIVLVGAVAGKLIADDLASIDAPAQRWVVALPVDIRGASAAVDVGFDAFGLHGWMDTPRVVIRFSGQLPVVNVIPGNAGYHVLVEQLGVTTWQVIDPTRLLLSPTKLDTEHLMNELLVYGTGVPSVTSDVRVDRRVPVGRAMLSASGEVSVSLAVQASRLDLGPDRILKVGDVPVFVASS
jgi:hypothetical protein